MEMVLVLMVEVPEGGEWDPAEEVISQDIIQTTNITIGTLREYFRGSLVDYLVWVEDMARDMAMMDMEICVVCVVEEDEEERDVEGGN